jgi:hypothetical protein
MPEKPEKYVPSLENRKRYCADPKGTTELDLSDDLDEEDTVEPPPPVELILEVQVMAVAEDGSRRRVCSHTERYIQKYMVGVDDLQPLQERLIEAAYEAFDTARNKVL